MKMPKANILAGLLALAAPIVGFAAGVPVVLQEGAVETTANELSLPSSEAGIITVRACATCSAQTFYFDKERQLIAGGKPLSLAQMTAALHAAGNASVTLHYRRKDQLVTRIVLMALPGAAR
jgi:hypothetical protein